MKFLIDAHLPPSLCRVFAAHGHDAMHTAGLDDGNASKDSALNRISLAEHRVVVSKDTDFYFSHLLHGRPWKLILVRTGNMNTGDMRSLFDLHLPAIVGALQTCSLVEIDRQRLDIVV